MQIEPEPTFNTDPADLTAAPTDSVSPSPALALSADDVMALLKDNSPQVRVELSEKLAGAYGKDQFNARETRIAERIFRLLVRDTEVRVRQSLSAHLKDSRTIPRDIVMTLARDVEQVALPVLQYSQVLTDDDLLDLIHASEDMARYLAIAERGQLSGKVSDSLVVRGNEEVITHLVNNSGAELSEAALASIINGYHDNTGLMEKVGERPGLPATTVEKLIHVVSESLGESLKQKYKFSSEHLEKEVEKTRESETLTLIRRAITPEACARLTNQLYAYGRLSPSIILSSLCQGNLLFFENSLARLANIPVANVQALLQDRGELGFHALYTKSGLPEAMQPAVKLLLGVVIELVGSGETPATSRFANHMVERLLQVAEETPVDNVSYLLALIRRVGQ